MGARNAIISLLLLASVTAAATAKSSSMEDFTANAIEQFNLLATGLKQIVGPVAVGLLVIAGIVYAVSQALDKDTRVKGEKWSISIVMGAIMGLLIVFVAPFLVEFLFGFTSY